MCQHPRETHGPQQQLLWLFRLTQLRFPSNWYWRDLSWKQNGSRKKLNGRCAVGWVGGLGLERKDDGTDVASPYNCGDKNRFLTPFLPYCWQPVIIHTADPSYIQPVTFRSPSCFCLDNNSFCFVSRVAPSNTWLLCDSYFSTPTRKMMCDYRGREKGMQQFHTINLCKQSALVWFSLLCRDKVSLRRGLVCA